MLVRRVMQVRNKESNASKEVILVRIVMQVK